MSLEVKMVKIRIDGKDYEAKPEKNLLETCLSIGIDIPHFCFHPALGSVGACRLCAVKKFMNKDDRKGRLVMSCMEPVTEGLIVSVNDPDAKMFRASVIESLMTNHPHDCPVCDEGGECHLQDMTIMTGHTYRRFDFKKRTHYNQELGPFINHEMNRCIQCYRCVRFYRDYAGGKDLNVFASRDHVYFGRYEDGRLLNEFSGNLVEVCPTGVFTDKTLKKHFTRKWDLTNAPSVCVHCSVGCNTIVSERYGSIRRIMSRYNGSVNGYFICDRGRFGYEFVNDEKRIKVAYIRTEKSDNAAVVEKESALSALKKSFLKNNRVIGIGSPRASIESNFALMTLVGSENFYHGISKREYLLTKTITEFIQNRGALVPSLKQIEEADAILVLGEDLTNTAPMIALALRQAIRNKTNAEAKQKGIQPWNDAPIRELAQDRRSPVFIATQYKDSLDDISENFFRASSAEIAKLANTVAFLVDKKAPEPEAATQEIKELAAKIAQSLKEAGNPLIISGTGCGEESVICSALNVVTALLSAGSNARLCTVLPECNSLGLSLFPGSSFEDIQIADEGDGIDTLVILENDLYRRAEEGAVSRLLKKSNKVVVIDHLLNKTAQYADVLLPAATFSESDGTIVNNEGRAQRYYKALDRKDKVKESWKWIVDIMKISDINKEVSWTKLDDIVESIAGLLPFYSKLKKYMPDADFRMLNTKIPRQTMRYSGRTAIYANINVSEAKLSEDTDSALSFSMEGQNEKPPSSLVPFYWTPGWNSVQAMYNYLDEPGGSMKGGDPGIRLFESVEANAGNYFRKEYPDYNIRDNELLVIPVYQIFGSEELSSASPSILQNIHEPFVLINNADANKMGVFEGEFIQLEIREIQIKVKVSIGDNIVEGLAGLSVNTPGIPFIDIPCSGTFHKL
jgi:NADH-quinone oxidoreductase subunit G